MTRPAQDFRSYGGLSVASVLPWLVAAVGLALLPFVFQTNSALTIMNQMAITIVFALAYNMLLGQGGMLSFGHAVYMGLGGFFCMHVLNWVEDDTIFLPLPFLPILGGLFGMGFAMLIGAFSTRKAGTVFAMISLGIGELVAACSVIVVAFFGGEEGISGDRTYATFLGLEWFTQIEVYYLTAIWLMISAVLMYLFSRTPVGRMANAVRDNPERAEFLGYSARWVRYYSFCASGFFCGVAGALFAINFEIVTEENLNLATSGTILLVTFLGGVGFFFGPIIGAVVFTLLQTVLGLQTELWTLYVGALFLATVMYFPGGLAGVLMMHALPLRLGRGGMLIGPYLRTLLPAVIAVLGAACIIETLFHLRHAPTGDHEMTLFWTTFDSRGILPWAVMLVVTGLAFWLARRGWPGLRAAWGEANTLPPDPGNSLAATRPDAAAETANPVAEVRDGEARS